MKCPTLFLVVSGAVCYTLFHWERKEFFMDQNDKNRNNRRGNRNSNLLGAGKLVIWALVLTLIFYCTNSYMGAA